LANLHKWNISKQSKIEKINVRTYHIIVAVVIIMFFCACLFSKNKVLDLRQTDDEIEYVESDYSMYDDDTAPVGVREEYSFILNDIPDGADCISFYAVHQYVSVTIDGKEVYSILPDESDLLGRTTGCNVAIVKIDKRDIGKKVEITITPVYKRIIGSEVEIIVSNKASVIMLYLQKNMVPFMLSALAFAVGVVFLAFCAFVVKDDEEKMCIGSLGTFSIMFGLWKLFDLRLLPLLKPEYNTAFSFGALVILAIIMQPFCIYIKTLLTEKYKALEIYCLIANIVAAVVILLQLTGLADIRQVLPIIHIVILSGFCIISSAAIREIIAERADSKLAITAFGMGICAIGLAFDLAQYYVKNHTNTVFASLLCYDVYAIVMGVIFVYDSRKMIIEAKRRAEEANSAKSRFLSNMSHDIRTPMNAIVGFTDIAEKYIDDEERLRDSLGKIKSSSDHLLKLINDVLDMSKIESGKIVLDVQPCSIKDVVENICNIMSTQMEGRGIDFYADFSQVEHYFVYCDPLRVNQVILNLLSNALKFTNPGGYVSLLVTEEDSDDPTKAVYEIRVKDTGIGMSEDFVSHAFDAFIREHDSQGDNIQGTGLGLAICKNIVELAGGTIKVNSLLGAGTEFKINIGFYIADEKDLAPKKGAVEDISFHGERLLLVDDNQLNREIVVEILSTLDLIIDSADDGSVAVDMIKNTEPNYYSAVLMDIQMPIMNGYEASRTIRDLTDPAKSTIPIIAMTANAFEEDKMKAYEAGMNAHVAKPIDIDNLLEVLHSFLN